MSDFCLDEEPCQARPAMGEGDLGVVRVWRMVKEGCRVAIKMEPLRYLGGGFALVMAADGAHVRLYAPNGKGSAICSWCQSGYWVEDCSR